MKRTRNQEAGRPKRPYGGRPSLKDAEQLHDQILDAAAELFTEHGYGGTSIEAIAAHAGVGKLTLYRRFADKDALFQAVALRMSEHERAEMAKIGESGGSLAEAMTAIGERLLSVVLSPRSIAFHRIMLTESARLPALRERAYADTPPADQMPIRSVFRRFADRGELRVDDVTLLERQFVQVITGRPLLLALLGGAPMSSRAQEDHVRKAVDLFLHGVAVTQGSSPGIGTNAPES